MHLSIDIHLKSLCSKFQLAMILRWRDMQDNMNYTSESKVCYVAIFSRKQVAIFQFLMSGHQKLKNAKLEDLTILPKWTVSTKVLVR